MGTTFPVDHFGFGGPAHRAVERREPIAGRHHVVSRVGRCPGDCYKQQIDVSTSRRERETELLTLGLLEEALAKGIQPKNDTIFKKLQAAGPQDVAELLPHLEARAQESILKLTARWKEEAAQMLDILQKQQARILETAKKNRQLLLTDFLDGERQQIEADLASWTRRLQQLPDEMEKQPARIRDVYDVKARRVEPVGLCPSKLPID